MRAVRRRGLDRGTWDADDVNHCFHPLHGTVCLSTCVQASLRRSKHMTQFEDLKESKHKDPETITVVYLYVILFLT